MAIEIKPTQTGVTQSLMQKPLKAEAAADAAAAASESAAAFLLSSMAVMLFGATGSTSVLSGVTPVPL